MRPTTVICARCRKVVPQYYEAPCGDRFCVDCHQFAQVLEQAQGLTPEQQKELIAELNSIRFQQAKR